MQAERIRLLKFTKQPTFGKYIVANRTVQYIFNGRQKLKNNKRQRNTAK